MASCNGAARFTTAGYASWFIQNWKVDWTFPIIVQYSEGHENETLRELFHCLGRPLHLLELLGISQNCTECSLRPAQVFGRVVPVNYKRNSTNSFVRRPDMKFRGFIPRPLRQTSKWNFRGYSQPQWRDRLIIELYHSEIRQKLFPVQVLKFGEGRSANNPTTSSRLVMGILLSISTRFILIRPWSTID